MVGVAMLGGRMGQEIAPTATERLELQRGEHLVRQYQQMVFEKQLAQLGDHIRTAVPR